MSAGPLDPTPLVVGVDGGGSHTRVVLADATGLVLARVEGGGTALLPGQESVAADLIKSLIADVLASADRSETRPAVCVVGVAGAGQERAAQAGFQPQPHRPALSRQQRAALPPKKKLKPA